jgi:hypothetical protein
MVPSQVNTVCRLFQAVVGGILHVGTSAPFPGLARLGCGSVINKLWTNRITEVVKGECFPSRKCFEDEDAVRWPDHCQHHVLSVDCLSRAVAARNQVADKFDCNLFGNRTRIHRLQERLSKLDALPSTSLPRVVEKAWPLTCCEHSLWESRLNARSGRRNDVLWYPSQFGDVKL